MTLGYALWGERKVLTTLVASTHHFFQHFRKGFLKIRDIRSLKGEIQNGRCRSGIRL